MTFRVLILAAALFAAPASLRPPPRASASPTTVPPCWTTRCSSASASKQVRLVVSYNAVSAGKRGDDELSSRVAPYLAAAAKRGIDVHVAFEHARGDAQVCEDNRKPAQCRLPSVAAYKAEVTKFLRTFKSVKSITAWNESNHSTQPTYRDPKRTGEVRARRRGRVQDGRRKCTVVAFDILDSANDPEAEDLDFSRTVKLRQEGPRGVRRHPEGLRHPQLRRRQPLPHRRHADRRRRRCAASRSG